MSRIGRRPVPIPDGVEVHLEDHTLTVKGPKGTLTLQVHPDLTVRVEGGQIRVERPSDQRFHKALHGTFRALIQNMVIGVTRGYERALEVVGVGYRVSQQGRGVVLQVGYSHPVTYTPPPEVTVRVEGTNRVVVSGLDKQKVNQVAAEIRSIRPPNPYTGKGIRYADEVVRLRAGKAAAKKK